MSETSATTTIIQLPLSSLEQAFPSTTVVAHSIPAARQSFQDRQNLVAAAAIPHAVSRIGDQTDSIIHLIGIVTGIALYPQRIVLDYLGLAELIRLNLTEDQLRQYINSYTSLQLNQLQRSVATLPPNERNRLFSTFFRYATAETQDRFFHALYIKNTARNNFGYCSCVFSALPEDVDIELNLASLPDFSRYNVSSAPAQFARLRNKRITSLILSQHSIHGPDYVRVILANCPRMTRLTFTDFSFITTEILNSILAYEGITSLRTVSVWCRVPPDLVSRFRQRGITIESNPPFHCTLFQCAQLNINCSSMGNYYGDLHAAVNALPTVDRIEKYKQILESLPRTHFLEFFTAVPDQETQRLLIPILPARIDVLFFHFPLNDEEAIAISKRDTFS